MLHPAASSLRSPTPDTNGAVSPQSLSKALPGYCLAHPSPPYSRRPARPQHQYLRPQIRSHLRVSSALRPPSIQSLALTSLRTPNSGLGWIIWKDESLLHKDLIFELHYLGDTEYSYTLNFSRPAAPILGAPFSFSLSPSHAHLLILIRSSNVQFPQFGLRGLSPYRTS